MTIAEITDRVSQLGNAWEQFKQVNDARLREIERKGHADPLYTEHLSKISHALDNYKHRLDRIETVYDRPAYEGMNSKAGESGSSEYKSAFCNYLRKGMDAGLEAFESKALSVGNDSDGGFLVTPGMVSKIIDIVQGASPVRQLASVETISTDALETVLNGASFGAGWTQETASVTDTDTPVMIKRSIPVHEIYAQPKATQKLIDDSAIDIESWLSEKVADTFSRLESEAFVNGDGVGKPRGFLTYSAEFVEQVVSGTNGAVTADGLVNLYYALEETYAARATFLMNRSVVKGVRLLKEATTNQYLWQPGLAAGTPDTLLGVPVVQSADMPTANTGTLSVALADFAAAYQIVDRTGIRVLRDPFTDKPFVKFYTTKRVGGEVMNLNAIKLLKLSNA